MIVKKNTGLVLEGGGMRGVFTSGVLDAFMVHQLYFPYTVAVSAGACNGMSYCSRQLRRARISNIDFLARYHYIGLRHLLTQGCIFDRKLLYQDFPNELIPFDFNTYFRHADNFEMVTTNCLTGQAMYLSETHDRQRALDIVMASSSLPYVSKMVMVDGIPMLDGGIVDSIPLKHAIERGYESNVVILTRNKGYRKSGHDYKIPHFIYRKYPQLRAALSCRIKTYNNQLEYVERLEDEGRIFCIRPKRPIEVGRIEKNTNKLEALYEEGYALGHKFCCEML